MDIISENIPILIPMLNIVIFRIPMVVVYPQEPVGLEAFKEVSFHAPPAGVMLTFGKNAGCAFLPLLPLPPHRRRP